MNNAQWATLERRGGSTATLVATRSLTHRGVTITKGLTRVSESSDLLQDLPDVFERLDSDQGREAVRSRGGDVPTKRRPWQI